MARATEGIVGRVPQATLEWLLDGEIPAVTALARTTLLGASDTDVEVRKVWARRNEYPPVAAILDALGDGESWLPPERDYKKYQGNLWQIHLLGELYADPGDERVQRGCVYAFARQLDDGSWSCNGRPSSAIPCLTANVGRALARLGFADDERVLGALAYITDLNDDLGYLGCRGMSDYTLNGYCHMLAPKVLLFLGEVPRKHWPEGATRLRGAAVDALRDKAVFRSLPTQFKEFKETVLSLPAAEVADARTRFLAERGPLEYGEKKGWLRFGYPLSYNSDVLEAMAALAAVGEEPREEYEDALEIIRDAADDEMRWTMRNSLNGKMYADVETKGQPSRWLTLCALDVLSRFA